MEELIAALEATWDRDPGFRAGSDLRVFDRELPKDYLRFLQWSNGGEGQVGSSYLSIWPVEELEELNQVYSIQRYLPEVVAIGSDGGGKGYGLDYVAPPEVRLVRFPFGDLDRASVELLGASFQDGLKNLLQSSE